MLGFAQPVKTGHPVIQGSKYDGISCADSEFVFERKKQRRSFEESDSFVGWSKARNFLKFSIMQNLHDVYMLGISDLNV